MNKHRSIWLSSLAFGLLGLFTSAGCEKSSDVNRMHAEATSSVKSARPRLEELQRRYDQLLERGRTLTTAVSGIADAGRVLGEAKTKVDQLKASLDASPAAIQAAAKTGDPEKLRELQDGLDAKVASGILEATTAFNAVESWLSIAEQTATSRAPAPPAPVIVPEPPTSAGTPATGSAAPH